MDLTSPPFSKAHQLCSDLNPCETMGSSTGDTQTPATALPGQPCILLDDRTRLKQFLVQEFWAQDLESMAPRLWVMATQSGTNVNPLHRQKIKGREIVVTEDPRLHLVWIHDRIFIKPLPSYLLSHAFWEHFLLSNLSPLGDRRDAILKAAMGYLRTYRYLIQHESDFVIAQQDHLRLIPKNISWAQFCEFITEIVCIQDTEVSDRYCYGELRLSRLNLYAPLFLRRFHYEQVYGQYGDYFARLYGPVLFLFAVVSTMLNSMQVEIAVEQVSTTHWEALWPMYRGFGTVSLVGIALVLLCFVLLWLWMILDEWQYAIRCRLRRRQTRRSQSKC